MSINPVRPTCSHYVFWVNDHTTEPATAGHYHRFPPQVAANPDSGVVLQKFPATDRRQWWGEWSDDAEVLAAAAKRSLSDAATYD
ncbi:MAG: hypothetical protein HKN05_17020 [Rhizobiales bacterium]|nr:hypothetical protein [Hyphomicrobiales bacterium]